jgi:Zn-dependent peptidase ImmA (M78 family)
MGEYLGYYNMSNKIKVICINNSLPCHKQRFVCAHELGHAILHPSINLPFFSHHTFFSKEKIEHEANIFASLLLFSQREYICIDELAYEHDIEAGVLKNILGQRLGQKSFWEY